MTKDTTGLVNGELGGDSTGDHRPSDRGGASSDAPNEVKETLANLKLDRKSAMLYLVDQADAIDRETIEKLATRLTSRADSPQAEPLLAVYNAVVAKPQKHSLFGWLRSDPVLARTAIKLEESTQETDAPAEPPLIPQQIDTRAGIGPGRSLLKDLYALEALGMVNVTTSNGDKPRTEIFRSTPSGQTYAKSLRTIFNYLDWGKSNDLVVLDKNGYGLARRSK